MSWLIGVLIALIIVYELVFGYFLNEKIKGCATCEDFNIHPLYADKKKAAQMLNSIDKKVTLLIQDLMQNPDGADEYVQRLKKYDQENIYEISPNNILGKTSFLRNKQVLILCLRKKKDGKLHDENTIMFVILHELSHMSNEGYGHDESFWRIFKFVLLRAVALGLYEPVDYSVKPITYCGLAVEFSPLYSDIKPINAD